MKPIALLTAWIALVSFAHAAEPAPSYPRPLRDLTTSYFPFRGEGLAIPEGYAQRKQEVRDRILLAAGLLPMPARTPLNAVIHGRVERDDYTIDRVFFESFPGHYVCGNLYLPKKLPADGKMPGILCPHGHWANGRFTDNKADSAVTNEQLAIGAERFESGARAPLQARCVQLARMGCAVFIYDMLGNADSVQITEHRSGRRPDLCGTELGTFGLYSPMADLRLESNFGLQTWNGLRAFDFLLTVPGVDPTRMACTGESGGGTQTLMLAALEDRLAAAFPCVMTSTAMQGGCTCENSCYLRINQGNIDIAAAFAPKPMGMTAANDWTKELATKGFPDLKMVWTKLGKPDNVMATFNTHWLHNYNHVSRTTMYGFMNKHFKLGFKEPVLEREFVVSTTPEMTVWTPEHPKPEGDKVGGAHEKMLTKEWSEDSDKQIAAHPELISKAWEIMIGRAMPGGDDVSFDITTKEDRGDYVLVKGTVHQAKDNEDVPCTFIGPKPDKWNGTAVLWLSSKGIDSLGGEAGPPSAAAKKLMDAGIAIACPTLYLPGATEQPMNPVKSKDASRNDWQWAACYTYGYNPSLLAHRVHDAMTVAAMMLHHPKHHLQKLILAGSDGAGAIAAAAAVVMKDKGLNSAAFDTEGFRFVSLTDQWHPMFVPGAVKYGDVPGLLTACAPLKSLVLGEKEQGGADKVADSVLKLAQ